MEKEYAIGIDLGGTSVKYALIDNEGVFYFQGKLPSKADVSAEAVIGQLVTAINEVKAFAQEQGYKINGIGIGTPGIVDSTNRIVLGGAENINGWENIHLADRIEKETGFPALLGNDANLMCIRDRNCSTVMPTGGQNWGTCLSLPMANLVPVVPSAVWNIMLPLPPWYTVSVNG